MLAKPLLRQFPLVFFIPYIKNVLSICNSNDATELSINTFVANLLATINPVESAFAYQKDSPITIALEALDLRRDRAFLGIKAEALAKTYHFDPVTVALGSTILHCFDKYGKDVQALAYQAETQVLDKLIVDFETDTNVTDAITKLGLITWVAELKVSNTSFNEKFLERNALYATKPSEPAFKLKPNAIIAYETLATQINSRNNIDNTGKYKTLIDQLNTLTKQYNGNIKKQSAATTPTTTSNS